MMQIHLTHLLLDQSKDLIWMIDLNFQLVYANKTYLKLMKEMTGVEKKLNESVLVEGFGEGYIEKWKTYYTRALKGEYFEIEEHYHHPGSGEIQYGQITFEPLTGDDHKIIAVACQSKDIKRIVKQSSESEQRFKALVQEGSDLIGILNAEGNYIYVSPTSTSILGIAPEEFIGRNRFEFIHPDDAERTLAGLQKITTENRVIIEPVRFLNHKKEWRWMETVLTNMLDNPAVKGIVANSRDITDKIEEQHKLKLLESVITNTKDAVLITEAEPFDEPGNRIIFINEAFTKITGYTAAEVIGKTPRMFQGPNSDKEELIKLSRSLRNWEPFEITTINYKKSGEEFWANFTVVPVADEKGWYTHWVSIERDVTEQKIKELENELLAQISINFNEKNDYINATKELCKSISIAGKFDWVELWTLNLEKSQIQLLSHYVAATEDEKFYNYSLDVNALQIAEGLAGKVWSERTQLLWNDIDNHKDFVRRDAAKKIGLKAVLGIPLMFNDEVVGVLKIGTKHDARYLKKYTQIFKNLKGFIGSELNRKKLENDLSHLFNAIPDILCLADFKGRFLRINKAGCELLGYSEEEILYHTFDEFVHPEDKDIFTNELLRLEHGENTFKFENRYLTKSGDIIWLSWYCNSALEKGLIYATAKNITEEKKLRELNREARSLAKIGSWEMDLVNQKIFWSDEVHQLHETDPKSFVPNLETGINFYREDFRQIVLLNVEKCISTGEPFDFEAVLVTAKKKELWVRAIGNTEFADGKCTRIYGSFQDINSLKESENRLLSFSENLPGIVYQYLIHPDGTDSLRYVSGAVEKVWGFTANEVLENVNLVWDQIKAGGEFEAVRASVLKSVQTKSRWTCRLKYVLPSGELRTQLGIGTPIFLADGTILYNSITLDITQEAKNEELLSQASQMARIGSWELDLVNQDGDNMYWSPMVMEIMEVDDSYNPTLTGSLELYRGENKEKVQQAVTNLINEGLEFDEEILILTGKGHERWIRIIGKSETANNKCTKIYGSLLDVHDQKVAALELERNLKALNHYKFSLDQSAIIAFTDQKGVITSVNDNFCEISGYNREELIGKTHQIINSKHHPKEFFKNLWKTITSGKVWRGEIKNLTKDGVYYWVYTTIVPFLDEKNKPFQFLAIRFDITSRKEADIQLLQANERFEKVTEATDDAIWDWDIANQTYYRSKAIERFFGKDAAGLFPESTMWSKDHFHPEDRANIKSSFYEAIANPLVTRWELEYRVINELGETLYVFDRAVIYRNNEGKAIRIVGAMTNISERKRMSLKLSELNESLQQYTSELERSNEELEQFAFVASHDLQEPLRMISSFMDQLQRKYGDLLDEKGHEYIHFATDGAKRMKQIILDLLDYSRANKPTEGKEEVDMNEVLSEFKELRRKLISEKIASIKSGDLPTLNTYKAAITQILHCLLDNALKYSIEGTPPIVEIDVAEKEKEWEFSIKDNGIGIEPQFFGKIFIIFQRLHNRDEYKGTGIGLSIAKRHIEFLGGRIWLESAPGEGTVFYFTIPKIK